MMLDTADRIARYSAEGWWGEATFADLMDGHAQLHPDREALVDPPNRNEITGGDPMRLTWRQLADYVDKLAIVLLDAGLSRDAVLVAQMANSYELAALYLACARIGVIVSPVPAQYREHELVNVIRLTAARAIAVSARIGQTDHAAMLRPLAVAHGAALLVFGGGKNGDIDVDASLRGAPEAGRLARYATAHPVTANDAICICWTSGSEGMPKGVARSHNHLLPMAALAFDSAGVPMDGRILNGRPFVTIGAMTSTFAPWIVGGGTLVNHHPFNMPIFVRQLVDERIDFTGLAPALLAKLLEDPPVGAGERLGHLRNVTSGSGPLSAGLVNAFERRFGVGVINVFGSTEGTLLISAPGEVPGAAERAIMFPRYGAGNFSWPARLSKVMETRLVDMVTGAVIEEPGIPGELRHRGPMSFTGYFNAPELTAAAFDADGFVRTGDLFEIAGDGNRFYRFVGRAKDIVVRGGMNISMLEIENLVGSHPAVLEVAALAVPDKVLGERLGIAVVARPGASIDLPGIVTFLKQQKRIALFKLPERFFAVDALPRTAVGKLDRRRLRELLPS